MATVLMTWELGAGTGHCINLLPIAERLVDNGHQVFLALRDVSPARRIFGELPITLLPAPFKVSRPSSAVATPRSFAHILHNTGFADDQELASLTDAWLNLYRLVKPDLILFEHSPSALLASRAIDVRRVIMGTGFFSPPDVYPLPDLRPWMPPDVERLRADEDVITDRIGRVLDSWGKPPLEQLSRLYAEVDENFLMTFAELDHYGKRDNTQYWGSWSLSDGEPPNWPEGNGPRIFGYLREFRSLPTLLSLIQEVQAPALLYVVDTGAKLRQRFTSETIRFVQRPLNIDQVARQCDLALLNGNAGTATRLLLGGVPSFHLPMHLEQALFSHRLVQLGAGLGADVNKPEQIAARFMRILELERFTTAAADFATRYAQFDSRQCVDDVTDRICRLVP